VKERTMKTGVIALSLALMLAFATLPTVSAQGGLQDWSAVQAIKPGTELIVETKNGESFEGKLSSVTAAALHLSRKGKSDAIDQNTVRSIYLTKKSSRIESALAWARKGAVIGAAIGVIIVFADRGEDANLAPAAGIMFGLPAGAIFGAVKGGKNRKGRRIYEAK